MDKQERGDAAVDQISEPLGLVGRSVARSSYPCSVAVTLAPCSAQAGTGTPTVEKAQLLYRQPLLHSPPLQACSVRHDTVATPSLSSICLAATHCRTAWRPDDIHMGCLSMVRTCAGGSPELCGTAPASGAGPADCAVPASSMAGIVCASL